MKAFARTCWELLLLRSAPNAFPKSWTLLALFAAAYFLTDALVALAQGFRATPLLLQTVFDTGLQALFFGALLGVKWLLPRFNQALTAWYGVGTIFNLLFLPVALLSLLLPNQFTLLLVPFVLLLAWNVAVLAHILRPSLNIGPAFALVIAAFCMVVNLIVVGSLFPLD
ncbi:MAG TPA: hypothetical protein VLG68_08910 [Gammaproteobacteria bacterium]|nr:hypothetical protein [Gammaproteobacteria bacterium]